MHLYPVPGRFPALERMSFYRVIPSQHLLPAQLRSVTLQEIRPPYNSELGSEVGTFYLVRHLLTLMICDQHLVPDAIQVCAAMIQVPLQCTTVQRWTKAREGKEPKLSSRVLIFRSALWFLASCLPDISIRQ